VLLKGINDKPYIMKKLVQELLKIRVRPYYIYQCDLATGTEHFRTSVATGIQIIEKLRGTRRVTPFPRMWSMRPAEGERFPWAPSTSSPARRGRWF